MTNKIFLILFSLILLSCSPKENYPRTTYTVVEREINFSTSNSSTSVVNYGKIKDSNIQSNSAKACLGLEIYIEYTDNYYNDEVIFIPEYQLSDKQRVIYDSVKTVIGL